jgi:hypothetical protein
MFHQSSGIFVTPSQIVASSKASPSRINGAKANEVGDHISLRSVLEAEGSLPVTARCLVLDGITGIRFPHQDRICTKFSSLQYTVISLAFALHVPIDRSA